MRQLVLSGRGTGKLLAGFAAVIGAALLFVPAIPAGATLAQHGDVIVSLDASFSPRRLPRHRPAPVSISFSGALRTDDGSQLPRLRGIELALATGSSRLDAVGLPVCPRRRLLGATKAQALQRCPDAVVGRGSLHAEVDIPGQAQFPVLASVTGFNGGARGPDAAVWLLAFSASPPASFVVPVFIRHRPGPLGTSLTGVLPPSLGPWPHVSAFDITFDRTFDYRGVSHSYLRASCPVPPRFTGGLLPFVRAGYFFSASPTITTTVVRTCHVR
ncbi:MAG: hypothetical protein WB507_02065 [Solirubrobacterales bacterium]